MGVKINKIKMYSEKYKEQRVRAILEYNKRDEFVRYFFKKSNSIFMDGNGKVIKAMMMHIDTKNNILTLALKKNILHFKFDKVNEKEKYFEFIDKEKNNILIAYKK